MKSISDFYSNTEREREREIETSSNYKITR